MSTHDRIQELVNAHPIVIFMKGTPQIPMCGFSAAAIEALKTLGQPIEAVNVLADPAMREGIKQFSNWPTIPQVYIGGKFVGGSDIVREMHASGELKRLADAAKPAR
jgi:monothiol glutaredoxin